MPPDPEQARVKVVPAVNAPVDCDPVVDLLPLQPPDAVQLVALVELHVSVEVCPLFTLAGFAVNETVGAGGVTATGTVWLAEPPAPEQVSV